MIISGSILTVSGSIPPPQIGVPVTLSYQTDGSWFTLVMVTSNPDGSYSLTWIPTMIGSYQLRTSWEGDSSFFGAISDDVSVIITKISITLSCYVSSTTITRGESIIVSGAIDPLLSDKMITIIYAKPEGSLFTRTVTTGSDGSFGDSYSPDSDGSWSVTASWDGDSIYKDASSFEVEFTVNTSLIGGPGWTDDLVVIGGFIILIVISLFMTFKR